MTQSESTNPRKQDLLKLYKFLKRDDAESDEGRNILREIVSGFLRERLSKGVSSDIGDDWGDANPWVNGWGDNGSWVRYSTPSWLKDIWDDTQPWSRETISIGPDVLTARGDELAQRLEKLLEEVGFSTEEQDILDQLDKEG